MSETAAHAANAARMARVSLVQERVEPRGLERVPPGGQERTMTTTLYPPTAPSLPGLRGKARVLRDLRRDGIRVSIRRRPVGAETGDFVLAEPLGSGRWLLGVGDAMGRGDAAEELAAEVRSYIRSRVARTPGLRTQGLAELMRGANQLVHRVTDGERFVSLLLMVLDAPRQTIRLANAGQNEPLAVGRSGGVIALEGHAPALGLLEDVDVHEAGPLRLPPGVLLLATTDGVTEAMDESGETFGRPGAARSLAAARAKGPRGVVRRVLDDVETHSATPLTDAATALCVRFER
jgi:sigma-B regulation protein RsbU (phosphoserine phosphatase)